MTSHQHQESLAVVLLPSGQTGQDCLQTVKDWGKEGLLKRAIWVTPEDVTPTDFGCDVTGHLIDKGADVHGDVFTFLARSQLQTLVFLNLQVIPASGAVDREQYLAAVRLLERLKKSQPTPISSDVSDDTDDLQFLAMNIIAAPTGVKDVPAGIVDNSGFHAHIVASPEDRRSADQVDRFVIPGRNDIGWAVAQAVSLAGAWIGMTSDPWSVHLHTSRHDVSSMTHGRYVTPMRSFARVLSSAATAKRALARGMLKVVESQDNYLVSDDIHKMQDAESVIGDVVVKFDDVDGGRIQYTTPVPASPPAKTRMGILAISGEFWAFTLREIGGVPRFVFSRSAARTAKHVSDRLVGEEGNVDVTAANIPADLRPYLDVFERQSQDAERELADPDIPMSPSAPGLWRTYRNTVFGLLDGSDMPDEIPTPLVESKRVVMPTPQTVIPDPDSWEIDDDIRIGRYGLEQLDDYYVLDPYSAREATAVKDILNQALTQVTHTDAQLRHESLSIMAAIQQLQATLMQYLVGTAQPATGSVATHSDAPEQPDAEGNVESDETEDASGSTDTDADVPKPEDETTPHDADVPIDDIVNDQQFDEPVGDPYAETRRMLEQQIDYARENEQRVQSLIDDLAADKRRISAAKSSFDTWYARRSGSFAWRLAKRIDDRARQTVHDKAIAYQQATDIPDVDFFDLVRARNQFAKRFLVMFGVGVFAAVIILAFGGDLSNLTNLPYYTWWILWGVIGIIWLYIIASSAFRRRSRFLRQLRILQQQQRDARRRYLEICTAEAALNGLYQQLMDWTTILSSCIYHPWAPREEWLRGEPDFAFTDSLPACVDAAYPDPEDVYGSQQLEHQALTVLASHGWRKSLYYELLTIAARSEASRDADDLEAALDVDSPAHSNGSRARLKSLVQSEDLQVMMAEHMVQTKAQTLYEERDTLTHHRVIAAEGEIAAEDTGLLSDPSVEPEKLHPTWQRFLSDVCRGTSEFGLSLWSQVGLLDQNDRRDVMSYQWLPPGMHESGTAHTRQALAAHNNRGVEISVRVDFGPPMLTTLLHVFEESKNADTGFDSSAPTADQGTQDPTPRPDFAW